MISYAPLWRMLGERNISTYTLVFKMGLSTSLVAKLRSNGTITTKTLAKLCKLFECRVEDIIEYQEVADSEDKAEE